MEIKFLFICHKRTTPDMTGPQNWKAPAGTINCQNWKPKVASSLSHKNKEKNTSQTGQSCTLAQFPFW